MESENIQLKPCPFCGGGETNIHDNLGTWQGMKYGESISFEVRHWCSEIQGQPHSRMLSLVGRDKESAIKRWNTRV